MDQLYPKIATPGITANKVLKLYIIWDPITMNLPVTMNPCKISRCKEDKKMRWYTSSQKAEWTGNQLIRACITKKYVRSPNKRQFEQFFCLLSSSALATGADELV